MFKKFIFDTLHATKKELRKECPNYLDNFKYMNQEYANEIIALSFLESIDIIKKFLIGVMIFFFLLSIIFIFTKLIILFILSLLLFALAIQAYIYVNEYIRLNPI